MDGTILPSSWSTPRSKEVVSHLELRLTPEYDQKYLTCRIITNSKRKKFKVLSSPVAGGKLSLVQSNETFNKLTNNRAKRTSSHIDHVLPFKTIRYGDAYSNNVSSLYLSDSNFSKNTSNSFLSTDRSHNDRSKLSRNTSRSYITNGREQVSYTLTYNSLKQDSLLKSNPVHHQPLPRDRRSTNMIGQAAVSADKRGNDNKNHHIPFQEEYRKNDVQYILNQKSKQSNKNGLPKFRKHRVKDFWKWESTITDISVQIHMFCKYCVVFSE